MGLRWNAAVVVLSTVTILASGCSSGTGRPLQAVSAVAQMPAPPHAATTAPRPIYAMPSVTPTTLANHDLRVMTFNLRVSTLLDGHNNWQFRKGMVVDRIRSFAPDLLGTQEGRNGQGQYLQEELPEYSFFGAGRNNGKTAGEFCGVYFRSSKFTKLDGGHFWLSSKPDKPGSKGWGAIFPRMVTWVKLQPRDGTQPFYWFNTHFDAWNSKARTESAKLLLARMNTIAGAAPSIVTGDFNAGEGSTPYRTLASRLIDAYRLANPQHSREEGTRHDFNGHRDGYRIDWVFHSVAFQAVNASIDRTRGVLGYPSDHFPVMVTLRPVAAPAPAMPVARIE